jgi:hypothetical protein
MLIEVQLTHSQVDGGILAAILGRPKTCRQRTYISSRSVYFRLICLVGLQARALLLLCRGWLMVAMWFCFGATNPSVDSGKFSSHKTLTMERAFRFSIVSILRALDLCEPQG